MNQLRVMGNRSKCETVSPELNLTRDQSPRAFLGGEHRWSLTEQIALEKQHRNIKICGCLWSISWSLGLDRQKEGNSEFQILVGNGGSGWERRAASGPPGPEHRVPLPVSFSAPGSSSSITITRELSFSYRPWFLTQKQDGKV